MTTLYYEARREHLHNRICMARVGSVVAELGGGYRTPYANGQTIVAKPARHIWRMVKAEAEAPTCQAFVRSDPFAPSRQCDRRSTVAVYAFGSPHRIYFCTDCAACY